MRPSAPYGGLRGRDGPLTHSLPAAAATLKDRGGEGTVDMGDGWRFVPPIPQVRESGLPSWCSPTLLGLQGQSPCTPIHTGVHELCSCALLRPGLSQHTDVLGTAPRIFSAPPALLPHSRE